MVADDGTFRVPELPLGEYELSLNLTEEPSESHSWRERLIGSVAKRTFEINDESPANVNLGVLKGEWGKVKNGNFLMAFPRPAELPDDAGQSSWLMPLNKGH